MFPDFRKFLKSLHYAWKGIRMACRENNFQIQLFCALLVVLAGTLFQITAEEWIVVVLCIGAVLFAEIINTAIEKLCDHLHPEHHAAIGKVKDLSAGAVLVAAGIALTTGVIIFSKYVMAFLDFILLVTRILLWH